MMKKEKPTVQQVFTDLDEKKCALIENVLDAWCVPYTKKISQEIRCLFTGEVDRYYSIIVNLSVEKNKITGKSPLDFVLEKVGERVALEKSFNGASFYKPLYMQAKSKKKQAKATTITNSKEDMVDDKEEDTKRESTVVSDNFEQFEQFLKSFFTDQTIICSPKAKLSTKKNKRKHKQNKGNPLKDLSNSILGFIKSLRNPESKQIQKQKEKEKRHYSQNTNTTGNILIDILSGINSFNEPSTIETKAKDNQSKDGDVVTYDELPDYVKKVLKMQFPEHILQSDKCKIHFKQQGKSLILSVEYSRE